MRTWAGRKTNKRVPVQLDASEIELAAYMAGKRNVNEAHFGPRTFTGKDSFEVHLEGAMGEIMVARFYNVDPDMVFMDKGGGAKSDNVIHGLSVEVKTTSYFGPMRFGLMVADHTYKGSDIYIQVCADTDTGYGELVGWTTKAVLDKTTPVYPDNNSKRYPLTRIVPESQLRPCTAPEARR